jgi:hypothetical protein
MEKYFDNQFCKIEFKNENSCLYHSWKPATKSAGWNEIKAAFLKYVEIIQSNKPQNIVVDERDMGHVFDVDEQKWIDNEMMPKILSSGLKKLAIVKSKDGFVELATELMMGEKNASKIYLKFVQSIDEANTWIK